MNQKKNNELKVVPEALLLLEVQLSTCLLSNLISFPTDYPTMRSQPQKVGLPGEWGQCWVIKYRSVRGSALCFPVL